MDLSAFPIAAAIARDDQICYTARLKKRRVLDLGVMGFDEFLHLHQPNSDDGCLGVVATAHSVDEARAQRYDILDGTAHFDAGHVVDD